MFALPFEQVGRMQVSADLDLFARRLRWFVAETKAMEIGLVHQLEAIVHKEMGVSVVVAFDELHGQSSLPVQPLLQAIPLAVGLRVKEIAKNVEFARLVPVHKSAELVQFFLRQLLGNPESVLSEVHGLADVHVGDHEPVCIELEAEVRMQ